VLLDALAVQDMEVGTPHRRGAEELFQERRLADAGLARDEDELPLALVGPLKTFVEAAQLGFSADEADTGLHGADHGRERLRIRVDRVLRRLVPDRANVRHETEATPMDRLDEAWRPARVSQRPP